MIFVRDARPDVEPQRIRWEEPQCPLCRGERHRPLLEAPDPVSGLRFAVVRCDECGLRFTSPRPNAATIGRFYREVTPLLPDCGRGDVHLVDVLEHVHDPLDLLVHVRRRLGPGGRLAVTVPNVDGPGARWFGPGWAGLDLPRHLTHFGPQTLRRMLDRAGFCVTALRRIPQPLWLASSALHSPARRLWHRPFKHQTIATLIARTLAIAGDGDALDAVATVE
jgi:SAM-dependent methyltransferase